MSEKDPGSAEQIGKRYLSDLADGQSCYTLPHAMWQDHQGKFWLRPGFEIHERPGAFFIEVHKIDGEYFVEAPIDEFVYTEWEPRDKPSEVTGEPDDWIPVSANFLPKVKSLLPTDAEAGS